MKYSILGFNQEQLINSYENITTDDLLMLDYICNAVASPSMEHYVDGDDIYVWLLHKKILQDLPILNISESRLKYKLKALVDVGLLKVYHTCTSGVKGSKAFYCITKECENLRYVPGIENSTRSTDQVLKTVPGQNEPGIKNNTSNILVSKDTNNIDKQLKDNDKDNICQKPESFLCSANNIKKDTNKANIDKFIELYNEHCPDLPKVRAITDKRKEGICKLIKTYTWNEIIECFDNIQASDFLKGSNGEWKFYFDFLFKPDKFVAILEGKYNGKKKSIDGLTLASRATKEDRDAKIYHF